MVQDPLRPDLGVTKPRLNKRCQEFAPEGSKGGNSSAWLPGLPARACSAGRWVTQTDAVAHTKCGHGRCSTQKPENSRVSVGEKEGKLRTSHSGSTTAIFPVGMSVINII